MVLVIVILLITKDFAKIMKIKKRLIGYAFHLRHNLLIQQAELWSITDNRKNYNSKALKKSLDSMLVPN